jgi:hypothetical protein
VLVGCITVSVSVSVNGLGWAGWAWFSNGLMGLRFSCA